MPTLTTKVELYQTTNRTRSLLTAVQRGIGVQNVVSFSGTLEPNAQVSHTQPFGFVYLQTTRPVTLRFNPNNPYENPSGLWEATCAYYFVATLDALAVDIVAQQFPVSYTAYFATLILEVLQ